MPTLLPGDTAPKKKKKHPEDAYEATGTTYPSGSTDFAMRLGMAENWSASNLSTDMAYTAALGATDDAEAARIAADWVRRMYSQDRRRRADLARNLYNAPHKAKPQDPSNFTNPLTGDPYTVRDMRRWSRMGMDRNDLPRAQLGVALAGAITRSAGQGLKVPEFVTRDPDFPGRPVFRTLHISPQRWQKIADSLTPLAGQLSADKGLNALFSMAQRGTNPDRMFANLKVINDWNGADGPMGPLTQFAMAQFWTDKRDGIITTRDLVGMDIPGLVALEEEARKREAQATHIAQGAAAAGERGGYVRVGLPETRIGGQTLTDIQNIYDDVTRTARNLDKANTFTYGVYQQMLRDQEPSLPEIGLQKLMRGLGWLFEETIGVTGHATWQGLQRSTEMGGYGITPWGMNESARSAEIAYDQTWSDKYLDVVHGDKFYGDLVAEATGAKEGTTRYAWTSFGAEFLAGWFIAPEVWIGQVGRAAMLRRLIATGTERELGHLGLFGLLRDGISNPERSFDRLEALRTSPVRNSWKEVLGMPKNQEMTFDEWMVRETLHDPHLASFLPRGIGLGKAGIHEDFIARLRLWLQDQGITNYRGAIPQETIDSAWDAFNVAALGTSPRTQLGEEFSHLADQAPVTRITQEVNDVFSDALRNRKPRFTASGDMHAQDLRSLENTVRNKLLELGVRPGRVSQLVKRMSKLKQTDWLIIRNSPLEESIRQAGLEASNITSIMRPDEFEALARRTPGVAKGTWADAFGEISYVQRTVPAIHGFGSYVRELHLGLVNSDWAISKWGRLVSGFWEHAPRFGANIEEWAAPELFGNWLRSYGLNPTEVGQRVQRFREIRGILSPAEREAHFSNFMRATINDMMDQHFPIPDEMLNEIVDETMRRYNYARRVTESFYGWTPDPTTGNLMRVDQPLLETELLNVITLPDPVKLQQAVRRFYGSSDAIVERAKQLFGDSAEIRMLDHDQVTALMDDIRENRGFYQKLYQQGGRFKDAVSVGLEEFRALWVDSVLLRPGWSLRVLPDENLRAFVVAHDFIDRLRSVSYIAKGGKKMGIFRPRKVPVHSAPEMVAHELPIYGAPPDLSESAVQGIVWHGSPQPIEPGAGPTGLDVSRAHNGGLVGPAIYTSEAPIAPGYYAVSGVFPEDDWALTNRIYAHEGEGRKQLNPFGPAHETDAEFLARVEGMTPNLQGQLRVAPVSSKARGIVPSRPPDDTVHITQEQWDAATSKMFGGDELTNRQFGESPLITGVVASEAKYGVDMSDKLAWEWKGNGDVDLWRLPIKEGSAANVTALYGDMRRPFMLDELAKDGSVVASKRTLKLADLRKGLAKIEGGETPKWKYREEWAPEKQDPTFVDWDADYIAEYEPSLLAADMHKPPEVPLTRNGKTWRGADDLDALDGEPRHLADEDIGDYVRVAMHGESIDNVQVFRNSDGYITRVTAEVPQGPSFAGLRNALSDPITARTWAKMKTNQEAYDWLLHQASNDKGFVNHLLQMSGYDGIGHVGGQISGSPAHRVWAFFDPENQLRPAFPERVGSRMVRGMEDQPDKFFEMEVSGLLPYEEAALQGLSAEKAYKSVAWRQARFVKQVGQEFPTATISTDSKFFFQQWAKVLDRVVRQSEFAEKIMLYLSGRIDATTGRAVDYQALRNWVAQNDRVYNLVREGETLDDVLQRAVDHVTYVVQGKLTPGRQMSDDMFDAILGVKRGTYNVADPASLKAMTRTWEKNRFPEIKIVDLEDALRLRSSRLTRARHWAYDAIMRKPSSTLNRQALWHQIYERELERRLKVAYKQGREFSKEELDQIEAMTHPVALGAKEYAINESLSYMFSYLNRSRFAEAHHMLLPFFSAYQEQFSVWTRLLWQNPHIIGRALWFGKLAEQSGAFKRDPDTGELQIGQLPLIALSMIGTLFHPIGLYAGVGALLAKEGTEQALDWVSPTLKNAPNIEWMTSVNSLNMFFQDPLSIKLGNVDVLVPTPGVGPLAEPFVDYFAEHIYPKLGLPGASRLLAWSLSNGEGLHMMPAQWERIFTGSFNIDSQQIASTKQKMMDLLAVSSSQHLDPKTLDAEAEKMARVFLIGRAFLAMSSAASPQPNFPSDDIRDEFHDLVDAGNSWDTAAEIMQSRYPNRPDVLLPTIAYTTWNAAPGGEGPAGPAPPTTDVVAKIMENPRFGKAAQAHPEFAFFLIPSYIRESKKANFDYNAWAGSLADGLRTYQPGAYLDADGNLAGGRLFELWRQEGWRQAFAIIAQREVKESLLGPDPSGDSIRDLNAWQNKRIAEISDEFPPFGQEWAQTQTREDPYVRRNVDILRNVAKQPLWKDTAFGKALNEYFAWRDPVAQRMYSRNISWDSKMGEDIQAEQADLLADLSRRYGDDWDITFNTWLENDLHFGQKARDADALAVPDRWRRNVMEPWVEKWKNAQDTAFSGYRSDQEQRKAFSQMRRLSLQAYEIEARAKETHPDVKVSLNPIVRYYKETQRENPEEWKKAQLTAAITPYVFLNRYQRQDLLGLKTTQANEELWAEVEKMKLDVYGDIDRHDMDSSERARRWEQFNRDVTALVSDHPDFKSELKRNQVWGWTLWKTLPKVHPHWYDGKEGEAWKGLEKVVRGVRKVFVGEEARGGFVDEDEFTKVREIIESYIDDWRDESPDFNAHWEYLSDISGDNLYEFLTPELWWIKV